MLEETARVVEVTQGQIWVVGNANSACAACMQQNACGTATLSKAFNKKPVQVNSALAVKVGDTVLVTVDERALLRAAFIMYLMPIVLLLIAAGVADTVFANSADKTLWILGSALSSLAASLGLIRRIRFNHHTRPTVLKVLV